MSKPKKRYRWEVQIRGWEKVWRTSLITPVLGFLTKKQAAYYCPKGKDYRVVRRAA